MNKDIKLISQLNEDWQSGKIKVKKAGGQTNRNWIVQRKGKKFFVRFPWERTDIVNRKIEGGNILALAKSKKMKRVAPRFLLYVLNGKNILNPEEKLNLPDGTMVMEYIEGKDINGKDLEKEKLQNALLKSLYAFHTSRVRFVNIYDVFRDEVSKYRKKAKKYQLNKLLSKKSIEKIEKITNIAKENLPLGRKLSTHNDLIFENLRMGKDGKIHILDFEYAGYNIREGLHYDLGIILGGNLFYPKPIKIKTFEKILKKAKKIYKKDLDDSKIYWGALTNVLVMFWWGLVKYFSCPKEEKRYFKKYVLDRARGIEFIYDIIEKK